MNAAFLSPDFWKLFYTLEADLSEADVRAQLDLLGADYPTHEETTSWQFPGKTETVTRCFVSFTFACGKRFSLLLEYEPDPRGSSKTLFLLDVKSGEKHQLGWWDRARRHPYCLRLEELQALLKYWLQRDPRWKNPDLPLLLLSDFVGFSDGQSLAAWQRQVRSVFARAVPGSARWPAIHLRPREGDYAWCYDPRLAGWVFTCDGYGTQCFSIRNVEHHCPPEGVLFPFVEWEQMLSQVQQGL